MKNSISNINLKQILIVFVLVRILLSIIFIIYYEVDTGVSKGPGDALEYKYVANSIVKGDGYISYEYNGSHRALGDNYIYLSMPFYPTYIAFFYWLGLTDLWVCLLSNSLIYLILIIIVWKISETLNLSSNLKILLSLGIMLCGSINLFSFKMLTELAGITFLTLVFWQSVRWWKTPNLSTLLLLSVFTGLGILTRIAFIILPFCIALMVILKMKNLAFKKILIYFSIVFLFVLPWMIHNKVTLGIFTPFAAYHSPAYHTESPYDKLLSIYFITDSEFWTNEVRNMSESEKKEMYSETDHSVWGYSKLYLLRMKELFRLYPSGEPFNKLYMQIVSAFFQIPFLIGLLLFIFTKNKFGKGFKIPWVLFIVGFIVIHIDRNLPHGRYMLPLLPIGYISFLVFIDQKLKAGLKLLKYQNKG